ncbi:hypothetical protein [Pseudonocardia parietis]|uniref:Uncharacterized protein n=1 Tax=Pseudonocardia parietis TaxID=570936 RepID=A0ABS4W761_9PSEU|nr:hypothetical protein [Pseudonocardia parietis]MBP2371958.1 hypothetical protein [Pseudonocardia parietis]
MSASPITSVAPRAPGADDARVRDDAVRRLIGEHARELVDGRLSTHDIVQAVEDSWTDLRLAGAPPACLPELIERLARVRLTDTSSHALLAEDPCRH